VRRKAPALDREQLETGVRRPSGMNQTAIFSTRMAGREVPGWAVKDRVGIGWHGGHCGYCV